MVAEVVAAALLYIVSMLLIAFAASSEVALASTSRTRIRLLLGDDSTSYHLVDSLLEDPARFLSTLMLVKSSSYVVVGVVIFRLSILQSWSTSKSLFFLFFGWLLLVTMQIVSRAIILRSPSQAALVLARYVAIFVLLLFPLSAFLRFMGAWARNGNEEASAKSIFLSEDGLRFLLHVGEGEGVIEEGEKQMIAGIFEFGDTTAREVMVPRLDVTAIEVDLPIAECLPIILSSGHSRIPVYQENIDNIIGLLYAKELLRCFHEDILDTALSNVLRPAYFVPESKKLNDLLHEMQGRQVHMAIIVDEYGGTAGIVTIEDMIEEIVGDIRDEYDSEDPLIRSINPNTHLFNARIALDVVSDVIQVDLGGIYENVDTLGGLIYSELGRVPEQGEWLEVEDWRFTVLTVNSRRIEQVRAEHVIHRDHTDPEKAARLSPESSQDQRLFGSAI